VKETSRKAISFLLNVSILLCCAGLIYSLSSSKPYSTKIVLKGEPIETSDTGPLKVTRGTAENTVRLLFAGDVIQHRSQAKDFFPDCCAEIRPLTGSVDLAFANLEFPVNSGSPVGPPQMSARFNGSKENVKALIDSGFRILITANNHAFDQEFAGLSSTLDIIRNTGGTPVGTSKEVSGVNRTEIPEIGRTRIYLAAYTYTVNPIPEQNGALVYPPRDLPVAVVNFSDWRSVWREQGMERFKSDIQYARSQGFNYFIAFCHWGEEWSFQPEQDQINAAHDLIDSGFDLVVGSHSHVLQGWEIYKGKLISYGLGNLISDFRPWQVRTGALLEIDISGDDKPQTTGFRYIPVFTELENHIITRLSENETGERLKARSLAEKILGKAVYMKNP